MARAGRNRIRERVEIESLRRGCAVEIAVTLVLLK
jgi:hypothetical protein